MILSPFPMFFHILLYISLVIFMGGLIYRVSTWFSRNVGALPENITTSKRFFSAIKGVLGTCFSLKLLTLLKVFIFDVMLQQRTLKVDFYRWMMHMLIFHGFMVLLLFHAFDSFISSPLFETLSGNEYYSTLYPFSFIRDLFGVLAIIGVIMAVYRRIFMNVPRLKTNAMDRYTVILVAVIILSGFLLKGTFIMSHTAFEDMVEYVGMDEEEVPALESYWVKDFGLVSPNVQSPFEMDVLEEGEEFHMDNCQSCHSSAKWAFTGYALAKILKPMALALDQLGSTTFLWYVHIIACFIGLAYLPFSKMFHLIVSPISLLANGVMDDRKSDPANIATRQIMELDACTHCGTCTSRCSMGVTYELNHNVNVLPSEKISSVKKLAAGKDLSASEIRTILEGLYLCTNCHRCTDVCPVGINLQSMWFHVREKMLQKGYAEMLTLTGLSYARGLRQEDMAADQYAKPIQAAKDVLAQKYDSVVDMTNAVPSSGAGILAKRTLKASSQGDTFSSCFRCTTCTTVCPVAGNYENDLNVLGMVPHQIIHAAILGLADPVFRSNMLWSCLGCYECQQHCPQGVHVADVFYELKNMAVALEKGNS